MCGEICRNGSSGITPARLATLCAAKSTGSVETGDDCRLDGTSAAVDAPPTAAPPRHCPRLPRPPTACPRPATACPPVNACPPPANACHRRTGMPPPCQRIPAAPTAATAAPPPRVPSRCDSSSSRPATAAHRHPRFCSRLRGEPLATSNRRARADASGTWARRYPSR
jgi:hypothetical protein